MALAISSMQSGKSPGPDGFPAEFFKKIARLLSPYLYSVLCESFGRGSLLPSFAEACITLIAKKGRDPAQCSSYRPISLINTDAKILAKILARRLESVLPIWSYLMTKLFFFKDMHSIFNKRRLLDIIYSASEDAPECVISIDVEKAFDRVEWVYLWAVLERFGFGLNFISWVKLLYSHPTASI